MTELITTPAGTTFRPEMKTLYLMVDRWARDCLEGRGELSGSLRRIIQMLAEVPGLEMLAQSAEADRDTYYALLPIPPIRRSMNDFDEELYEAIGEDAHEDAYDELEDLSERRDPEARVNPLIVCSHVAHTKYYLPACLAVMQGMVAVFKKIGEWAGHEAVYVDPSLIPDLRLMRLEIRKGYTRAGVIQKIAIQGLFIIPYAVAHESVSKITLEDAAKFFAAAVNAIEWSYAVTNLHGAGWSYMNREAAGLFMQMMVQVFAPAARFLETTRRVSKAAVELQAISDEPPRLDYPFAFFLIKKDSWLDQSETMIPEPFSGFPYKSTQKSAGLSLFFCRHGGGKTSNVFSVASQAAHDGSICIIPKSDLRNQGSYFRLPAFGKQKEMREIMAFLRDTARIEPHPIPVMILNVLRSDEKELLRDVPLTDCDRFVWVHSTQSFHFDWKWAMKAFWKIHESFPFDYKDGHKPRGGIILVRYIHRHGFNVDGGSWNEDLQVAVNVMAEIVRYRQNHRELDFTFLFDELQEFAARESRGGEAAGDKSSTAGQVNQIIVNMRGMGTNIVGATLLPLDTIGSVVTTGTNICWRNLPQDQAEALLKKGGLLQGIPPEERELALALNDENWGAEDRLWWWYNGPRRELNVLRPNPPPIFMDDTTEDPRLAFVAYEEESHTKVLLNWKEIDWEKLTIADETQTQPRSTEVQGKLWGYATDAEA